MNQKVDPESEAKLAAEIVVAYLDKNILDASLLPSLVRAVRQALSPQPPSPSAEDFVADLASPRPLEAGFWPPTADAHAHAHHGHAAENDPSNGVSLASRTVSNDFVVCLEDGGRFRSLRRHLMIQHNLTPEAYRAKWNLPRDYPMVAPSFAEARSDIAKRTKLGHFKRPHKPNATPG